MCEATGSVSQSVTSIFNMINNGGDGGIYKTLDVCSSRVYIEVYMRNTMQVWHLKLYDSTEEVGKGATYLRRLLQCN